LSPAYTIKGPPECSPATSGNAGGLGNIHLKPREAFEDVEARFNTSEFWYNVIRAKRSIVRKELHCDASVFT
jgi:hypothetical protein